MNAYLLGKENMDFGKQVIYGKNGGDQNNIEDGEGFDMSNQDAKSHISEPPELVDLSRIPDEGSPPVGAAAAPEPDFLIEEATAEEQNKRQAAIDAEIEANRSIEEKNK